jgi:hypothetical protein
LVADGNEDDNTSVEPSFEGELVGCENDDLIPSNVEINTAILECQRIWRGCISNADFSFTPTPNPQILLQRVPPLPQDLPKARTITGQSLWHTPCPELSDTSNYAVWNDLSGSSNDAMWNPEHVHGPKKTFTLFVPEPTEFRLSSQTVFSVHTHHPEKTSNGIAILTICWSYILSVRFLEMQKRRITYSSLKLSPELNCNVNVSPHQTVVYLGHASYDLVRWMCALLAPGLGWLVRGPLPPWAANYHSDARFIITVSSPFTFHKEDSPPSSSMAVDLLAEFCSLFGLYTQWPEKGLDQPTAGFLSALMLPFSNYMFLELQLPRPILYPSPVCYKRPPHIQALFNDLPYYMTLAIRPESVGSVLWSIFWQPKIKCNLASAWLGSIREVLNPLLKEGDWEMLAKVFYVRDPQRYCLWLGVFLHGDSRLFDMILSYLDTHEERYGYASLSGPDIDVAQWTGLPQSFLDEEALGTYRGPYEQVPLCDLFRNRFNFRIADPEVRLTGWQPCGQVRLKDIEPELWPRLEQKQARRYVHWVWWLENTDGLKTPFIQPESRHGCTQWIQERPKTLAVIIPGDFCCKVNLKPSVVATRQMVVFGSKDAGGNLIPVLKCLKHPWLAGIRL